MRLATYPVAAVICLWVLAISSSEVSAVAEAAPDLPGKLQGVAPGRVLLAEVTPAIPDGPVVQKFKKMEAKKLMDKEVAKQETKMKPALERKKEKKKAQKNKMQMLADLEIKRRISSKELGYKQKARDDAKKEQARVRSAKQRRMERYEKLEHNKAQANVEKLGKLHSNTDSALTLAKKLFEKKRTSLLSAASIAKRLAQQKEELRVGGLIHLKGEQILNRPLVDLNKRLKLARQRPTAHNLRMAKIAYNHGAMEVAKENERFKVARRQKHERLHKQKLSKIRREADAKDSAKTALAASIRREKWSKRKRQEKIRLAFANGRESETKRWKAARATVNAARAKVRQGERNGKAAFNQRIATMNAEKSRKAPVEAFNKAKTKLKERQTKYSQANGAKAKFLAKSFFGRARELVAATGKKAGVNYAPMLARSAAIFASSAAIFASGAPGAGGAGGAGGAPVGQFRAQFWSGIHGLSNMAQAKQKIQGKAASVTKNVAQINYASTNGPWPGLDNNFRDNFVVKFEGSLKIVTGGKYTFWTNSDDGSSLSVNGKQVVNNDGTHGMRTRSGSLNLSPGTVKVTVWFFENGGGAGVICHWSGPGFGKKLIGA